MATLAILEAKHDWLNWRKMVLSLFAPDAKITTITGAGKSTRTLQQYIDDEQRNLAAMSSATGTVEHDYVQSLSPMNAGQYKAESELTTHMHEVVAKHQASVDELVKRDYLLEQQKGSWRIVRLIQTPLSITLNGKPLSLAPPRRARFSPAPG